MTLEQPQTFGGAAAGRLVCTYFLSLSLCQHVVSPGWHVHLHLHVHVHIHVPVPVASRVWEFDKQHCNFWSSSPFTTTTTAAAAAAARHQRLQHLRGECAPTCRVGQAYEWTSLMEAATAGDMQAPADIRTSPLLDHHHHHPPPPPPPASKPKQRRRRNNNSNSNNNNHDNPAEDVEDASKRRCVSTACIACR